MCVCVATSAHPVPFPHPIRYIAPEIVKGTGHGKAADYYALGCFLYECISGWTPYVRDDEYGLSIYRYVVKNPVEAPEGMATDSPAWILLSAMLEKDPAKRIGTLQAGCVLELMNQLTLLAPCLLAHPPPPPPSRLPPSTHSVDGITKDPYIAGFVDANAIEKLTFPAPWTPPKPKNALDFDHLKPDDEYEEETTEYDDDGSDPFKGF